MQRVDTEVLVVGAGPVGLTLAIDLAQRGVTVTVIEQHRAGEPTTIRSNHISARSMELFRRLGIAGLLRENGLPADYPCDAAYFTTLTGAELSRVTIPSTNGRRCGQLGPDTWWPTPEPPHRMNQRYMEPLLAETARNTALLTLRDHVMATEVTDGTDTATVACTEVRTGADIHIHARYVVGCDGGRSMIRKKMGARFLGQPAVQRFQSAYIRAPWVLGLFHGRPAWHTQFLNPRRSGGMIAIDGRETWLIHVPLGAEEQLSDDDRDTAIRTMLGIGPDLDYEVMGTDDWVGRRLVADSFRSGRLFICGDSAHVWVPYAGYGMNAGLADAADLSWLLWAHLRGWAPAEILDAYQRERLPVTDQVSQFAMGIALAMSKERSVIPPHIEENSRRGVAARERLGRELYEIGRGQLCCGGLNFGYFYADSPIIAYDDGVHPEYTMYDFVQSTVPGCRVPHVWLGGNRSLYDALGPGFSLLRLDPRIDVSAVVHAAEARAVPLGVVDVDTRDGVDVYDRKLVLARPDQHVAWRGDEVPDDPVGLIDLVRGAGLESAHAGAPVATRP
jgi:2-polyprenyl-6-methoxyphenol hydroxylase-like FAD-dependent oxidoreductase